MGEQYPVNVGRILMAMLMIGSGSFILASGYLSSGVSLDCIAEGVVWGVVMTGMGIEILPRSGIRVPEWWKHPANPLWTLSAFLPAAIIFLFTTIIGHLLPLGPKVGMVMYGTLAIWVCYAVKESYKFDEDDDVHEALLSYHSEKQRRMEDRKSRSVDPFGWKMLLGVIAFGAAIGFHNVAFSTAAAVSFAICILLGVSILHELHTSSGDSSASRKTLIRSDRDQ